MERDDGLPGTGRASDSAQPRVVVAVYEPPLLRRQVQRPLLEVARGYGRVALGRRPRGSPDRAIRVEVSVVALAAGPVVHGVVVAHVQESDAVWRGGVRGVKFSCSRCIFCSGAQDSQVTSVLEAIGSSR